MTPAGFVSPSRLPAETSAFAPKPPPSLPAIVYAIGATAVEGDTTDFCRSSRASALSVSISVAVEAGFEVAAGAAPTAGCVTVPVSVVEIEPGVASVLVTV